MRKRVSLEAQHDLIVQMASQGLLSQEIADATGSIRPSIRHYIYKHQIPWSPDRALWGERPSACAKHHETVKAMAEAGATLKAIAAAVGTSGQRVRDYLDRHGIQRPAWRESPGSHPMSRNTSGPLNPAWNGGRTVDKDGYVLLWMPGHPEANRHGQVREHRIVMARMIGRPLLPEEVVDHRNDVRDDNDPSNLQLYPTNAEHLKATLTGRWSRESRGLPPSTRNPTGQHDQPSPP